jgi:hypothetical protein
MPRVTLWHTEMVSFVEIPQIDVETFTTWAITFVAKVMAIIRATGEAVVTCGHEVSHGTRITEPGEIPIGVGVVLFLGAWGPARRLRRPPVGPRLTTYGIQGGQDMP